MTRLFLFAHQDDEIGALHTIAAGVSAGERAICVFLTDGTFAGITSARRQAESLAVLTRVGAPVSDIHFIGDELGIADGRLVEHLDRARERTLAIAARTPDIGSVLMHAWEGGHHDHDAAHLVGRAVAAGLSLEAASRQFPLYRASADGSRLVYGVLDPQAGPIDTLRIPFTSGLRRLALLRHYRSQARVMMRLGPHIARAWLVERHERLQALPAIAPLDRPAEHLLYERWKFYSFERFRAAARPFVETHLAQLPGSRISHGTGA